MTVPVQRKSKKLLTDLANPSPQESPYPASASSSYVGYVPKSLEGVFTLPLRRQRI